jgi:RNA polymerase sigma factor (sigma-70 family)
MMGEDPTDVGAGSAGPPRVSTGLDQGPDPDEWVDLVRVDPVQADPGERAAQFEALYRQDTPRLVRFLILDGAPAAVAAELAQETMTALWQSWDTVTSPKAWSRRVASRKWIRYRTQVPELPIDILPETGVLLPRSQDAETIDAGCDLLRLLSLLTPRQRQVMARTYDGDTAADIAAELGMSEATVRSTLRHARQEMERHHPRRQEGQR